MDERGIAPATVVLAFIIGSALVGYFGAVYYESQLREKGYELCQLNLHPYIVTAVKCTSISDCKANILQHYFGKNFFYTGSQEAEWNFKQFVQKHAETLY
ncbi:hypothetical protein DRJ19_05735, partial [Candidatus Woesearchaeota archaeon]